MNFREISKGVWDRNRRSPAVAEIADRTAFSGIAVQQADLAIPDVEI